MIPTLAVLLALCIAFGAALRANDDTVTCLIIDEDSIDNEIPPNFFNARDVNDDLAYYGVRVPLRYWVENVGKRITLWTGQKEDEGWFEPRVIIPSWNTAGPTKDGLANFFGIKGADGVVRPGVGLGTPDQSGNNAEILLDKIPEVIPLREPELYGLVGKKVFAIVYDSDVSINYNPITGSLKGANLGVVAFRVISVTPNTGQSSSTLPKVEIEILDPTWPENQCGNSLDVCVPRESTVVGTSFTADVKIIDPTMANGGFTTGTIKYSWGTGGIAIDGAGGLGGVQRFDTACNREAQYNIISGACGCEETFTGGEQPQLFVESAGGYWNSRLATTLDGRSVVRYTRSEANSELRYIYLDSTEKVIVRLVYTDNRVIDFSNVKYGPVDASAFPAPSSPCKCARDLDVALVVDGGSITLTQFEQQVSFAQKFVANLDVSSGRAAVSVLGFSARGSVLYLTLSDGNSLSNLNATLRSLPCGAQSSCGGDGDIAAAIRAATAQLAASVRSGRVPKAIVILANNWQSTDADIQSAVAAAEASGATIIAVAWETRPIQTILPLVNNRRENIYWHYSSTELAVADPKYVVARLCALNNAPCGNCCGVCDVTCRKCGPVAGCAAVVSATGCTETAAVVGACCALVPGDACPNNDAACSTGVCTSGKCQQQALCPASNSCYDVSCDLKGGCLQEFKAAEKKCETARCTNGSIVYTAADPCGPGNLCFSTTCDESLGCVTTRTSSTDPSCALLCKTNPDCENSPARPGKCYEATCDQGQCKFALNCDDGKKCTVDTCENNECKHTPKCQSDDPCKDARCDESTGDCILLESACDDGISCTADSCVAGKGCEHTISDELCNLNDQCSIGTCTATGCQYTNKTCEQPAAGTFCLQRVCVPFQGCIEETLNCREKLKDNVTADCAVFVCDEEKDECAIRELECTHALLAPELIATVAGVSAAAIAGIVIGALVFFGVIGGGVYAGAKVFNNNGVDSVSNNPLYKDAGVAGDNPLHKPAGAPLI